jgi:hypothetical protein
MKFATFFFLFFLLNSGSVAKAQDRVTAKLDSCELDIKKYCPGMPTFPDIFRCLATNAKKISPACQRNLAEVRKKRPGPENSKPPFAPLMPMGLIPPQMTALSYSGSLEPSENHTPTSQQNVRFQTPIYLDDKNSLAFGLGGSSIHLESAPNLASSGDKVPTNLYSAEVSAQYSRKLEGDRTMGGRFSVGSASDHPFADLDVTTITVGAEYSYPVSESSRWILGGFYSNNGPFGGVPLPTFVYSYNTKSFGVILGFPVASLRWMPVEEWSATLGLLGPNLNSEIAHGRPFALQEFVGFSWGSQLFIQQNRINDRDRFYYIEKRAQVGARLPILPGFSADLTTGYAFDREVSVQKTYFFSTSNNSSSLGDSVFVQLGLRLLL